MSARSNTATRAGESLFQKALQRESGIGELGLIHLDTARDQLFGRYELARPVDAINRNEIPPRQ